MHGKDGQGFLKVLFFSFDCCEELGSTRSKCRVHAVDSAVVGGRCLLWVSLCSDVLHEIEQERITLSRGLLNALHWIF